MKLSIAVVENHQVFLDQMITYLRTYPDIVGTIDGYLDERNLIKVKAERHYDLIFFRLSIIPFQWV